MIDRTWLKYRFERNVYVERYYPNTANTHFFCLRIHFFLKKFAYMHFLLYLCSRFWKTRVLHALERWQSGRLRRSWKPLSWEAPGVRIPLSPQHKMKNESEGLVFLCPMVNQTCLRTQLGIKKEGLLRQLFHFKLHWTSGAETRTAKESTPTRKETNPLRIGFYAFLKKNARLLVYLHFLQYLCRRFYKNRFRQCFWIS